MPAAGSPAALSSGTGSGLEMDLSSAARNISAGQFVQGNTVDIRTGVHTTSVTPDSLLTAAEAMAVSQVLSTGQQSLRVNRDGVAVGGSFALVSDLASALSGLVIPRGVTAVNTVSDLNLGGNLVNHGTLYAVSSTNESSISANNIYNNRGALISTVVPEELLAQLSSSNYSQALSLSLNAVDQIVNAGTITSAANLSLSANKVTNASGSVNEPAVMQAANNLNLTGNLVVNSGTISALSGNLNVASQAGHDLAVHNFNGLMEAKNGNMNVTTDSSESQRLDINFYGGDMTAKQLSFTSTGGDVTIDADDLNGRLSICAANAFTFTETPNLVIGDMIMSDDPQFYNQGDITINGDLTYSAFVANDNLVIVASGDINTTGGNWNIGAAGESNFSSISVLMVAGADFSTNGTSPSSTAAQGGGDSSGSTVLTINGGTSVGGMIDLNTTPIASLSTSVPGSGGNAGTVTLIAFGGSNATAGTVLVPSSVTIDTGTNNTNASQTNGAVIIIAGSTQSGTAMNIGGINTSGNIMNPQLTSGTVTLAVATPTFVDSNNNQLSSLTLVAGGGNAGNPIIANGDNFAPGSTQQGDMIVGGAVSAGGNVSMVAGGSIDLQGNVSLTQNPQTAPTPAGYNAQPTISLTANTVTVGSGVTVSSEIASCTVCANGVNIVTQNLANDGTILGWTVNVTSPSAGTALAIQNSGTITGGAASGGANDNAFVSIMSLGNLTITGTGTYNTTGAVSVIELAAADNFELNLNSSNTFGLGTNSLVIFNAQGASGQINESGNTQTIQAASSSDNIIVSINTPNLMLNNSTFDGTSGPTTFALTAGTTSNPLTITVASGATATIETTAQVGVGLVTTVGGIYMRPRDGQDINITSTGSATLNLETNLGSLDPVLATNGGSINVTSVTIPQTYVTSTNPSGGISGVAFQPYVGPQSSGGAYTCFSCYPYQQVLAMIGSLAATQQFQVLSTYTQSSNSGPSSAGYVIQAAKQLGLWVSAGVALSINTDGSINNQSQTNLDISLAIAGAQQYGNVIDLVVGNEDVVGNDQPQASINTLTSIIQQAQEARNNAGFSSTTLPVTTRQQYGIYNIVSPTGLNPANPTAQAAMATLLQTVDGYVYANIYPFFDPPVIQALQANPTMDQTTFTSLVYNQMNSDFSGLANTFVAQGVTTQIRIGETGWATAGDGVTQANPQWAAWYYPAMQSWSETANNPITGGTGVPILGYFEGFNEPIKITDGAGNQEPHWGIFVANGTVNSTGMFIGDILAYDLQSITTKYSLPVYDTAPAPPPVSSLTNLDLTSQATTTLILQGQASGQFGGTLIVNGSGVATGGNVILTTQSLAASLSQINIPASVTATFQNLTASTSINVGLTGPTPMTVNGELEFTGTGQPTVTLNVTSSGQGTVLNIGSTGVLDFGLSQGTFIIAAAGNVVVGGNMTGNMTVQTTASNGGVTLNGSIGSASSSFNFNLNGTGSLTQTAGTITGTSLSLTSKGGSFGSTTTPLNTNVGILSGSTTGMGTIAVSNAAPLALLATSAGKNLQVAAAGNLTVSGALKAGTSVALQTTNSGTIALHRITSPTISLTTGQGNVTSTANAILTASKAVNLTTNTGIMGTFANPINTVTPLLNAAANNANGSINVSNTGKLKLGTVNIPGTLIVQNNNSVTIGTAIPNIGQLTVMGTSVSVMANIGGAASFISLIASGSGNVAMSKTVTGNTLSVTTGDGTISGTTNATNLSLITGSNGKVSVNDLGTPSVGGTGGTGFTVTGATGLIAGNITNAVGNIKLTATTGQLSLQGSSALVANNGNIELNAKDKNAGSIVLNGFSSVTASGASNRSGNVTIYIGTTVKKANEFTPTNVTPVITQPGRIFYGTNSIVTTPPQNTFTANQKTIIFDSGNNPAATITVNGTVSVTAQVSYENANQSSETFVDTMVDTGDYSDPDMLDEHVAAGL